MAHLGRLPRAIGALHISVDKLKILIWTAATGPRSRPAGPSRSLLQPHIIPATHCSILFRMGQTHGKTVFARRKSDAKLIFEPFGLYLRHEAWLHLTTEDCLSRSTDNALLGVITQHSAPRFHLSNACTVKTFRRALRLHKSPQSGNVINSTRPLHVCNSFYGTLVDLVITKGAEVMENDGEIEVAVGQKPCT